MDRITLAALALLLLLCTVPLAAQESAEQADPAFTWDLSDIYPPPEAWEQDRQAVIGQTEAILARRGTLGDSAAALFETVALR